MRPEDSGGEDDDDAGWSSLHDGIQPSPVVRGWLSMVRVLASGPVLRIPPDVLSTAGVLMLAGAWLAVAGPRWPALAVPLILGAGVLDGLDGAVALRTGKARPLGAMIDSVADRIGDLFLAAVLWSLGAPLAWVLAAVGLVLLLEYVRARAQAVGMPGVGAVTVAERPTRLILVIMAAGGASVLPAGVPGPGWSWGATFAVTWTVVGVVGMGQLLRGVGRSMPPQFPPPR
ncbi:CDP-diacylglycerol--glycerol-3-phosphate 3-phosphatidyltransferase [Mycobacterium antarcticum]|uniref:CDP-alcohol phosphatidyltransferase family protein n=1 Tax=Mycolicibacterium sp. TUM20985 TaxID=3023370 RepID=UPI002574352A|nr:CDP-alcohol phosphatidyltransferase family protein [Mycolicibacterium sp. TUM20985]BDX35079.1 CDP-diacylglycerol--glycerol-3-phosphate 3-phosphatidyltransferase [Mycolicibacterium sp. TUM20985]